MEILEGIGAILLIFGALYLVNRIFYFGQKATGVRLVQNHSQRRDLKSLERFQSNSLAKEDPDLIRLASMEASKKGYALTASTISDEVDIIKNKLGIEKSSEELIFEKILKEAEKRAGFWTTDPIKISKYVQQVKREWYPKEYYKIDTDLSDFELREIEKKAFKKFYLYDVIDLNPTDFKRVKVEIIRNINLKIND